VGELVSRRGAYDVRRWSTVFPVGMYAACSFGVAQVEGSGGIERFARIWIWIALVVWLAVFGGLLGRIRQAVRRLRPAR
jgi:tellurite resistance protein TehA-like permease